MSAIISAPDEAALLAAVSDAAVHCGFEKVMVGTQWMSARGDRRFQVLSGYPQEWQFAYAQRGYMAVDPTVSHCQSQTTPLVWSPQAFIDAGATELFEEARVHGLDYGVSVPIHEAAGVKTMVSLVRDKPLNSSPHEEAELVKAGELVGNMAHFSFRRLLRPQIRGVLPRQLTPSEITVLRWVANGKTAWEIGSLMNVTEATVNFHMKNAMRKLDVVKGPQAIAAAFRLGLLD